MIFRVGSKCTTTIIVMNLKSTRNRPLLLTEITGFSTLYINMYMMRLFDVVDSPIEMLSLTDAVLFLRIRNQLTINALFIDDSKWRLWRTVFSRQQTIVFCFCLSTICLFLFKDLTKSIYGEKSELPKWRNLVQ